MAFYDADWLGRPSAPDRPSLRTTVIDNGNLLQSSEGGVSARPSQVNLAAVLASRLPSNQPFEMSTSDKARLKQATVEDLARPFKGQAGPQLDMDLNRFKTDRKWLKLYETAPEEANEIFRESYGVSFDDALKKDASQKKFLLDTIQKRVGSNELRQSHTGEWEEMGDMPDPTAPSGTRKGWTPASFQTQDMLRKIGGAESLGLMDVKRGLTALALRNGSGVGKETGQAPPPSVTPTPNKRVEGLVPMLSRVGREANAGVSRSRDEAAFVHEGYKLYPNDPRQAPFNRAAGNAVKLITGGEMSPLYPPIPEQSELELVNNLRSRQGKPPITGEQYQAWLQSRRASR